MPKFSTSLAGTIIVQAGYDTYTDVAGTVPATNGASVAAFKGSGLNFTQSNAGKRPTLIVGGTPWGLDCIRFDGTSDVIEDTSIAIGPDLTVLMVMRNNKRLTGVMASGGVADPSIFSGLGGSMSIYQNTGGQSYLVPVAIPNHWALIGVSFGLDRLFVADDREFTVTVGSKIAATTKLSIGGYTWAGGNFSEIDVMMAIICPTSALTSGNIATLRSELAAYLGSLPVAVSPSRTLIVVEGNSVFAAGAYADRTDNEYTALAAGTRWDMRNIGVSASVSTNSNNSLNARRSYRDAYPASVGRTRENSVLIIGEGLNAPADISGFIAEVNYAAAQGWYRVVVVLPNVTSGWGPGDANVTTFYNTVKATSFPENVVFLDSRQGVLATYNATYFQDTVHPNTAGHAALSALLVPVLDAIPVIGGSSNTEEELYDMELVDDECPYTPHDTNFVTAQVPIDEQCGFYVEADGAVKVTNARGRDVTYAMKAGHIRRLRVLKIWDTGTDATTVYIRAYPVTK